MRADVRAVPVIFVREKNDARLMSGEDISDGFDACPPIRSVLLAGLWIDLFKTVSTSRDEAEADVVSGGLQLAKTLCLPFFLAAVGHRHIEEIHFRFAHQP
jgi:hypothetical protein